MTAWRIRTASVYQSQEEKLSAVVFGLATNLLIKNYRTAMHPAVGAELLLRFVAPPIVYLFRHFIAPTIRVYMT